MGLIDNEWKRCDLIIHAYDCDLWVTIDTQCYYYDHSLQTLKFRATGKVIIIIIIIFLFDWRSATPKHCLYTAYVSHKIWLCFYCALLCDTLRLWYRAVIILQIIIKRQPIACLNEMENRDGVGGGNVGGVVSSYQSDHPSTKFNYIQISLYQSKLLTYDLCNDELNPVWIKLPFHDTVPLQIEIWWNFRPHAYLADYQSCVVLKTC